VSLVVLAAELQVMQTLINVVGTSPELWGIRRASSRVKAMAYSRWKLDPDVQPDRLRVSAFVSFAVVIVQRD
jgi:hypothetical protein